MGQMPLPSGMVEILLLQNNLELSARARSRSIKHERALALCSLNHDLAAVDDIDTALGLGLVYALAVQVVDDGILQVGILGSLHGLDGGSLAVGNLPVVAVTGTGGLLCALSLP